MVVALLVVGPSKLPELARTLGRAFNDFRRMADDVKETLEQEMNIEEPAPGEEKKTEEPEEAERKAEAEAAYAGELQPPAEAEPEPAAPETTDGQPPEKTKDEGHPNTVPPKGTEADSGQNR